MLYSILADAVVLLHALFILFAVFGGLLLLRWRWFVWLHLPALLWGAGIEISGGICPLTPLENELRQLAGAEGYTGGFIEHYLIPIIYPAALTRELQWLLAGVLVGINAVVYLLVWRAWSARSRS